MHHVVHQACRMSTTRTRTRTQVVLHQVKFLRRRALDFDAETRDFVHRLSFNGSHFLDERGWRSYSFFLQTKAVIFFFRLDFLAEISQE